MLTTADRARHVGRGGRGCGGHPAKPGPRQAKCALDRLTGQDLITLWPDDVGWPQDVGALAILDGTGMFDADDRFRLDAVRGLVESRLNAVPRLRQVILEPGRWGGRPLWVDARAFDIRDHVGASPVPAPGNDSQLLAVTETLRRRPLDRSRPLWEMWFMPGLARGRVGMYIRVHHVIADGVAGVALLTALFTTSPDVSSPAASSPAADGRSGPRWTPASLPATRDLLRDNVSRRLGGLSRALATLVRPTACLPRAHATWSAARRAAADGNAPRCSINTPIGPDRTIELVRADIDRVASIAHDCGATVNDVLLEAVTSGLRELLRSRGEPAAPLRALVPVSLHGANHPGPQGNLLGQMVVTLPVGKSDPKERLRLITAETATRKRGARRRRGSTLRSKRTQRALLMLMARQRMANVYVANVPGPSRRLYLGGAPLLEVFPIVPLIGNFTIGVGAFSYDGQFTIAAVGDRNSCPDLGVFAHGMGENLG